MYTQEDYLAYYQFEETFDLEVDEAGESIHYYFNIIKTPTLFSTLPEKIKENTYLIHQLTQANGLILEHLNDSQRDDLNIVFDCICQNLQSYQFASERVKNYQAFLLKLIDRNAEHFFLMNVEHQSNPIYIEKALKRKGLILEKMPQEIKENEHFVHIAIHQNGLALRFADKKFKHNLDIIRDALNYARGFENDFVKCLPKKIKDLVPKNPTFDAIYQVLEKIQIERALNFNVATQKKSLKI